MFFFFGLREEQCIEQLDSALKESGVTNLVGAAGTGKTHLLRCFAERVTAKACVLVDCSRYIGDPSRFIKAVEAVIRPWRGREGRFVLVLDEWCSIASDLRDGESSAFEHIMYVVLTRGVGSGLVFGSRSSVRDSVAFVLPSNILAKLIEVDLSRPFADQQRDHWERLLRMTRNKLAHDVNVDEAIERLRQSPWWDAIEQCVKARPENLSGDTRWAVMMLAEVVAWAEFLSHLCATAPWILDESRSHGYDPLSESGATRFAAFLARNLTTPERFVAELLRPSDLDSLFPETQGIASKAERVAAAKLLWQRRRAAQ